MPISEVFNIDCMEYMKGVEDNFFDLAIVDPPYGIGEDKNKTIKGKAGKANTFKQTVFHKPKNWDNKIPEKEYFKELFRVSKNQIIWGGNYFTDFLYPVKSWVFWYKKRTNPNNCIHSDGELAWTSFLNRTRMVDIDWIGFGYINSGEKKIHTSQKPVSLYKWLLNNYATCKSCNNEGGHYEDVSGLGSSEWIACEFCECSERPVRIFDSHMGSQSSRIACHQLGFDFWGCELDEDYFKQGCDRFKNETKQIQLFNC